LGEVVGVVEGLGRREWNEWVETKRNESRKEEKFKGFKRIRLED